MWEIQQRVAAFDRDRFRTLGPGYLALNIAGEAGELANVIKKLWRSDPRIGQPDGFGAIPPQEQSLMGDELADVVILSLVLANHLRLDLELEVTKKLQLIDERLRTGYYGHEQQRQ